jgi:SH3 domain protein
MIFGWKVVPPSLIVTIKTRRRVTMKLFSKIWLVGLTAIGLVGIATAESNWVIDSFEITMRTGPSTENTIVRMLPSGTELEVLSRDAASGYTQVRTPSGAEGWVLTRYLMDEPSARAQLATLTRQMAETTPDDGAVSQQLDAVRADYEAAARIIDALEQDKAALEQQLAEIQRTPTAVLAVDERTKALREQLAEAEITVGTLEQRNRELTSQANRYWFITGASVLVVGLVLGIWLPRVRWQRRSRYDRF